MRTLQYDIGPVMIIILYFRHTHGCRSTLMFLDVIGKDHDAMALRWKENLADSMIATKVCCYVLQHNFAAIVSMIVDICVVFHVFQSNTATLD